MQIKVLVIKMATRLMRVSKEFEEECNRRMNALRNREICRSKVDITRDIALELRLSNIKEHSNNQQYDRTNNTGWIHYRKRR